MSQNLFPAELFRQLVSGRWPGIVPTLLRGGLSVAELGYTAAMRLRNFRYDRGRAEVHKVGVPVVSIGNVTLGGTGKTPLVEWTARRLRERGLRVAIVSRGYGVEAGTRNDEALELEQRLPDVPHLQNADRVEGARTAVEEFESQVLLLDDGFQHRRLHRDLDVVLLDALEPFGYEHVFPRGMLREPLAGLARAQVVVLSRADLVDEPERRRIHDVVRRYNATAAWCEVRHAPLRLLNSAGVEQPIESLWDRRIAAFCGLGNPAGFRRTLSGYDCCYRLATFIEFEDHQTYEREHIDLINESVATAEAEAIVCTHKDLVKVRTDQLAGVPLWAVVIGIEFLSGEADFRARLDSLSLDS